MNRKSWNKPLAVLIALCAVTGLPACFDLDEAYRGFCAVPGRCGDGGGGDDGGPRQDGGEDGGSVADGGDGRPVVCDGGAAGEPCLIRGCPGTTACSATGELSCAMTSPQIFYPDVDRDGYGDRGVAGVENCAGTGRSTTHDDCDDHAALIHPGAAELCDGLDNDCSDVADDHLDVSETWYPDEDNDAYGRTDAGVRTCSPEPGLVQVANDCDDGDPYSAPNRRELCDGRDNDCDGEVDESACANAADWNQRQVGTEGLRTASAFDAGRLWVAGEKGVSYLNLGGGFITDAGTHCNTGGNIWTASYADPLSGTLYLAGEGSRVALAGPTTGNGICAETDLSGQVDGAPDLTGMVGFRDGGTVSLYVVSRKDLGRSFRWTGGTTVSEKVDVMDVLANDVHGLAPSLMFAVGGTNINHYPAIARYQPPPVTGWSLETVPEPYAHTVGELRGVWVVNANLAIAVGDNGLVLEWDGKSWKPFRVAAPSTFNFRAVVAFGRNRIYAVTARQIVEFVGDKWLVRRDIVSGDPAEVLWDITGVTPADLWAVGGKGLVFHYPDK